MICITCGMMMTHLKADLFICKECGLVSSDIPPDPSIYDKSYDIKYKRYQRSRINVTLQEMRICMVMKDKVKKSILDFGCGSGSFVEQVEKSIGFDCKAVGFDINPYGNYCDVISLLNGFDTVTFWDSLEHVQNPKKLIEGLNAEHVFVSTPSIDDCDIEYITRDFHHYYPGEHVHYFNEKSLKKLLEVCGYEHSITHYRESILRKSGGDKNILTMGFKSGSN